jgi:hypothetical protein
LTRFLFEAAHEQFPPDDLLQQAIERRSGGFACAPARRAGKHRHHVLIQADAFFFGLPCKLGMKATSN